MNVDPGEEPSDPRRTQPDDSAPSAAPCEMKLRVSVCPPRAKRLRVTWSRGERGGTHSLPEEPPLHLLIGAGPLAPGRHVLHALGLLLELAQQLRHLVAVHHRGEVPDQPDRELRAVWHDQPVPDLVHDVPDRGVVRVHGLGGPRRLRHVVSSAVWPSSMTAPTSCRGVTRVSSSSTCARPAPRSTSAERTPSTCSSAS